MKERIAVALLLYVVSTVVYAQNNPSQLPRSPKKLLEHVAEEAHGINDLKMRAHLQAKIANLFWSYYKNEREARTHYKNAFASATNYYLQSPPFADVTSRSYAGQQDERLSIIKQVITIDPDWLNELVDQCVQDQERHPVKHSFWPDTRFSNLKSYVWLELAKLQDPNSELHDRFMKKSLVNGTSIFLPSYLSQLAANSRRETNKYYKIVLDLFAVGKLQDPAQFMWLSAYPFGEWVIQIGGKSGIGGVKYVFHLPEGDFVDAELIVRFLSTAQIVFARFIGDNPGSKDKTISERDVIIAYEATCDLEWKVEQYAPQMLFQWRQVKAKLAQLVGAETIKRIEHAKRDPSNDLRNYRRIKLAPGDELKPPQFNPNYHFMVQSGYLYIWPVEQSNPKPIRIWQRTQEHPSEKVPITSQQSGSARTSQNDMELIHLEPGDLAAFHAANQAIHEQLWGNARNHLSMLKQSDLRAVLMAQAAIWPILSEIERLSQMGKHYIRDRVNLAKEFLDGATQSASTTPDSYTKVYAQILTAMGYLELDPGLNNRQIYSISLKPHPAFELLRSAVNTANRLPDLELNRSIRISGRPPFANTSAYSGEDSHLGFSLISGVQDDRVSRLFSLLAGKDLKKSLILASEIKHKVMRLTAILGIIEAQLREAQRVGGPREPGD